VSTEEQLYAAAVRILTDGRRHAVEAVLWARHYRDQLVQERRERAWAHLAALRGFTPRELSLGAEAW
jgi:hypothetical protein